MSNNTGIINMFTETYPEFFGATVCSKGFGGGCDAQAGSTVEPWWGFNAQLRRISTPK